MTKKKLLFTIFLILALAIVAGAIYYFFQKANVYHTGELVCREDNGNYLHKGQEGGQCRLGLLQDNGQFYLLSTSPEYKDQIKFANYLNNPNSIITVKGEIYEDPELPTKALDVTEIR